MDDYEKYCEYRSGSYSKFLIQHPEFAVKEFEDYVIAHNKADRDSGKLQDISMQEIERLASEWSSSKHEDQSSNLTHALDLMK